MQQTTPVTPDQRRRAAMVPPYRERGAPTLDTPLADEGDYCSNPLAPEDQLALNQVTTYFTKAIRRSLPGQQFLRRLGLNDPEVITAFKLGYSDRTLCHRLGDPRTVAGGTLRGRMQRLGILRPSGHELFRGSLVVPILNERGDTEDMYGHKSSYKQRYMTPLHVSLFDPPRGVFNIRGIKGHEEIVLCGVPIDALTLWCHGVKNVTTTLGVKGLTVEHLDTFARFGVKRVVIAFERTKMGDDEARYVAQALDAMRIDVRRMDLPSGLDVNTYSRLRYPTKGSLQDMVRDSHEFRQTYINLRENMECRRAQKRSH
ncbi:MAG TPA: toprim domain-containing protein [Gammaproteobacteria bacterium]